VDAETRRSRRRRGLFQHKWTLVASAEMCGEPNKRSVPHGAREERSERQLESLCARPLELARWRLSIERAHILLTGATTPVGAPLANAFRTWPIFCIHEGSIQGNLYSRTARDGLEVLWPRGPAFTSLQSTHSIRLRPSFDTYRSTGEEKPGQTPFGGWRRSFRAILS
jgi:hypothetical protein